MEFLNRIELKGIVSSVRITPVGDTRIANLSVATNSDDKDKEGNHFIETTWHHVSVLESKSMASFDDLEKGAAVHVIGRIRSQKYLSAEGCERTMYVVAAQSLEFIQKD